MRARVGWIAVAGMLALPVAGCGFGPQPGGSGLTTTWPSSAASTTTTQAPTTSPEEAAILKQYRAFYELGLPAAYQDPTNARSHLAPYATGDQLKTTSEGIYAQHVAGYEARGGPTLKPRVATLNGETAEVHDCQDSSNAGIWKGDQQLRKGQANAAVQTTMRLIDGAWKLAATAYPEGHPAGYC